MSCSEKDNVIDDMLALGLIEEGAMCFGDDYVSAIVGASEDGRVIYDYDEMVQFLVDRDGMTGEEAVDFVEYNAIRSLPYMGQFAPIIMYSIKAV